ncbi:D-2-hydroxyacid dehydrogenase [Streptomyces boninensis]|uniref:D-2-hydroxyacid dehydrogenase n=1 Tax=Streptomyces boninensis TaxID=2039455 RepID=UPI003B21863C
MSQTSVLVLEDDPPPDLSRLTDRVRVITAGESGLAELLPQADVLLVWDFLSDAVRDAWPASGPTPSWVHTASAGVDRLMFPGLVDSDTQLTNARGVFDQPIAEYVAGLVLAMAKDFRGTYERQRQHRWQHRETLRVAGTRAVVVGSGPIGRAIGRTLSGLGVVVDLVGRTEREGVRAIAALPELLPKADWVVSAAPLTDDTREMFGKAAFEAMPDRARFINVGRGALVVQRELAAALESGELAGAALDVFEAEPLPAGDPLWDVQGLFISPHMSGDVVGWRDALSEQFCDNFDRWAAGEPLFNVVDKRAGYVRG